MKKLSLLLVIALVIIIIGMAADASAQYSCPFYCDKRGNCQWIPGVQSLKSCEGPMTDCHDGTAGPCAPHCHTIACDFASTSTARDRQIEQMAELPDISERLAGVMSPTNWEAFQAEVDAAIAGLDDRAAVQRTAEMYVDKARQLHFYAEQRE